MFKQGNASTGNISNEDFYVSKKRILILIIRLRGIFQNTAFEYVSNYGHSTWDNASYTGCYVRFRIAPIHITIYDR